MTTIDIIILIIIGAGVVAGFMKGFIRQLASILGLVVGLLAAKALYATLAEKLCPAVTDSMTVAQVLDRKSTRLNSSHRHTSRMPSSA